MMLMVRASLPVNTYQEYIAYARANPGKLNWGSAAKGGVTHLVGAWLHQATNTEVTFIHYKGTAPATTDLTGGRVQVGAFGLQPALPLLKSGKLRALALMGSRRSDLVAGLPKTLTITSQEVREALLEPIQIILESVRLTLERCPPELSSDLVERGVVLAGGGALLRGLDRLLSEETGLPIHVAEDPLSAVVEGTGKVLDELEFLTKLTMADGRS